MELAETKEVRIGQLFIRTPSGRCVRPNVVVEENGSESVSSSSMSKLDVVLKDRSEWWGEQDVIQW